MCNCVIAYSTPIKYEEWQVLEEDLSFQNAENIIEKMKPNRKLGIWLWNPDLYHYTRICGQKCFDTPLPEFRRLSWEEVFGDRAEHRTVEGIIVSPKWKKMEKKYGSADKE